MVCSLLLPVESGQQITPRFLPLLRMSNLLASLGHTERRVVLGHTLYTRTLTKTDEQKKKGGGFK